MTPIVITEAQAEFAATNLPATLRECGRLPRVGSPASILHPQLHRVHRENARAVRGSITSGCGRTSTTPGSRSGKVTQHQSADDGQQILRMGERALASSVASPSPPRGVTSPTTSFASAPSLSAPTTPARILNVSTPTKRPTASRKRKLTRKPITTALGSTSVGVSAGSLSRHLS